MYYKITEISNLTGGGLYALVSFWADQASHDRGDRPAAINDFHFPNLQAIGTRIITDGKGWWKRADGIFVDPATVDFDNEPEWAKENFDVDLLTFVHDSICAYWSRRQAAALDGKAWPADHTDARVVRKQDDPRGLRTSAVMAELNVGRDAGMLAELEAPR